ncbi:ABC transporter ATP-binding protein [Peribacillus frigoritolerans]|uniref:ABC transporter ATP-binding protein n=1 Tax=Peribacillus frigoritolerans TaxID=450367 RepID=UPI0025A0C76B|nr:ABC transporter ATP-binding protein [Peribacillus frigoritolerans]MDM5309352.1 ABC transporter ATP-binding protein [Peribacillus frigoritolerans]MDM5309366.1 ABC transporter ATP-binding protein [Peribacillus frigoritolerans]
MHLVVEHLSKKFGDNTVLDDINIEFTEGVYGILGANGSGKSTLMRILVTVLKPTSGNVILDGENIKKLDEEYRNLIGYLPQEIALYKSFTAERFLMYIASLKGLNKNEAKSKVSELLELVGLTEYRKKKVGTFSGGMKQRVGIAQALLNDPKVLIVDEPTAGLDPKERIRFRNLLSAISSNRIVLLSTHIVSDIDFIAKEIVILKQGKLIKKDAPNNLLGQLNEKVWTVLISEGELQQYQNEFKVGNIIRRENGIELRIISDTKPIETAQATIPNLEDLYLYYFDKETIL